MRRHLLIGTLDSQDNAPIPSAPDEIVTRFPLDIKTVLQDLKKLHIFPSEIGVDLINLATHVHAADTRISRFTESQDTWTREFRLIVPVSAPQLWAATSDLLARMLNFLTGDKWDIGFRSRPVRFSTIVPRRSATLITPRLTV